MTNILVYDDTEEMLVRLSDKYGVTIAELVDRFLMDESDMEDELDNELNNGR